MTRYLVDTHLLLWAAGEPQKLSARAVDILSETANDCLFSAASIWEVAIKSALGRADFVVDPSLLAAGLRKHAYLELPITAAHAARVAALPRHHQDPFDRILAAQANVEGLTLLTRDSRLADYPGGVELV